MTRPYLIQWLLLLLAVLGFIGKLVAFIWRWGLVLVLGPAVLAAILERRSIGGWAVVIWSVAALVVAAIAARSIAHARRQLVIETFLDHRPTQAATSLSSGSVASLLALEIGRLAAAHTQHDMPPTPTSTDGGDMTRVATPFELRPVLGTSDLAAFLSSAVTADTQLDVGPVKLPLRPLTALLGRVAEGPRLGGAIFADDRSVSICAHLSGSSTLRTWEVQRSFEDGSESDLERTRELVRELACRVFTDLARPGTTRWRAARAFVAGLEAYRAAMPHPQRRLLSLHKAAAHFLDAIHEDPTYGLAQYNLGLVNGWQIIARGPDAECDSAEPVLLAAIATDPSCWYTYHALASHRYDTAVRQPARAPGLMPSVIDLCDHMRAVAPDRMVVARALMLRGRAWQSCGRTSHAKLSYWRAGLAAFSSVCDRLVNTAGLAPADAAARVHEARTLAGSAWAALADADSGRPWSVVAGWLYWLVLACDSTSASGWRGKGLLDERKGRSRHAALALREALRIHPDDHVALVHLSVCEARSGRWKRALAGVDRLLAHPSRLTVTEIAWLRAEVLSMMRALTGHWRLPWRRGGRSQAAATLRRDCASRLASLADVTRMRALAAQMPYTTGTLRGIARRTWRGQTFDVWRSAFASVALASDLLGAPGSSVTRRSASRAEALLLRQRGLLARSFPTELAALGVDDLLARAQRSLGHTRDVLETLTLAQERDPLHGGHLAELAEELRQMGNFDGAVRALEGALNADGDRLEWHLQAGLAGFGVARNRMRRSASRAAAEQAMESLKAARDLATWSPPLQGTILAALGVLTYSRGRLDEASTLLGLAHTLDPDQLSALLILAETDLRRQRYTDSQDTYRKVIDVVEAALRTGMAPDAHKQGDPFAVPLDELATRARLGLVMVAAETDGLVHNTRRLLAQAHDAAKGVKPARHDALMASYYDVEGWVAFKSGDLRRAARALRESVGLDLDNEVYWRLAQVLAVAAERETQPLARLSLLEKAIASCHHVMESGFNLGLLDQVEERAGRLLAELETQAKAIRWSRSEGAATQGAAPDDASVQVGAVHIGSVTIPDLPVHHVAGNGTTRRPKPARR